MFIFNGIRMFFGEDIEKLKPLVRDAYKRIYDYQLIRTDIHEKSMRETIAATTDILKVFIEHIPAYKSKYIQILQRQNDLNPYDLIISFDRAIYELHLYAALGWSGKYAKLPWSKELRALLDERQEFERKNDQRDEIFEWMQYQES